MKRSTKEALLDAAEELFAEDGVDATTIAAIAERAGSSVGAFYHHFRDKRAIQYALFDRFVVAAEETTLDAVSPARWEGAAIGDILHGYVAFSVGGDVAQRSFAVLKPGGRAAFIASGPQAPESPRPDVQSLRPAVGRDRPHMERIVELFEAGAIRVPEITTYPLSQAEAAHRVSEGRHLRGKLVFEIR